MSAIEDFKSFAEVAVDDSVSRRSLIEFACAAIRDAVEAEREACAMECEDYKYHAIRADLSGGYALDVVAKTIRGRGSK